VIYNPYVVVPLAAWAVAQVSKFAIAAIKGKIDFRYLYASGGMPSVHSAVVCSLAATALLVDGAASHLFGFTVIFAAIVMYDSYGVRRASGEQGMLLNMIVENLDRNRFRFDVPPPRLREILGHKPREVAVGALLGIALACLFNYDKLGPVTAFLQTVPVGLELWIYVGIFAALVLGGIIARIVLTRRYKKSQVMRQFRNRVFVAAETIGWVGLVTCVFIYERATYLAWRAWPLILLLIGLIWAIGIATTSGKELPQGLKVEANERRKQKWFKFGRKSK
jgi:acid phosphatase family membrane protein YuiD